MKNFGTILVPLALGLCVSASAQQAPVNLRSDAGFAVLAGTTVTVTGAGSVTGNVGVFPGTAYVAGTPPVTINGVLYAGGPVAAQAEADLTTAFNDAAGRSVAPATLSGNIGGLTLTPGLYKSTSSLAVSSGNLTLDAQGNTNAVWIFQIASTLTTTSGRQVILAGGANPANIFWQVGSSATLGTTSVFQGNILAGTSISLLTGATLAGRALALGGAVSIDTGGGSGVTVPVVPTAPTVTSATPAPGSGNVPLGARLAVIFSTAMNPATITASTFTLTQGSAPVSGVVTYVGTTATFTPSTTLAPESIYTGTITSGVRDQSGNALAANYVWTFTSGFSAYTNPPTVISAVPAAGAAAVAIGNKLSLTFSEPMNPSTINATTFTLTQGATPVPGVVTFVGSTATFTPSGSLAPSTAYTATMTTGATDLSGYPLASSYTWSFFTGSSADLTPPTVTSSLPVNGAQGVTSATSITAVFSKPMDPLTVTNATFTLQQGASPVAGTVTYNGATAIFVPSAVLAFSTTYTATITNGARDLAGNALAANYVWSFTTGTSATMPHIQTSGVVNGADYLPPVAAGSIAAVFGTNLTVGLASSALPGPLPTTLAQTTVTMGGRLAPLYLATPGQVTMQIPWELAGLGQTYAAIIINGIASNTQLVPLAPYAPAIFSTDSSGTGQGAIEIAPTAQLAAPGSPVSAGGYIAIYCTGLGPVTNQPATGAVASANPLSLTLTTPTVTVGGLPAVVSYSGLAPGLAGLYQVNAIVPLGVTPGNAVTVVLAIGSTQSNSVTIAVQ